MSTLDDSSLSPHLDLPADASLEQKRAAVRSELRAQRRELAIKLLAPHEENRFPRSFAMRFIVRQPGLLGWLVTRVAGPVIGVPVTAVLLAVSHLQHTKNP